MCDDSIDCAYAWRGVVWVKTAVCSHATILVSRMALVPMAMVS